METQVTTSDMKSAIFQVDKALESWRDSGFICQLQ